mgnify:CR=1 FL=1
MFDYLVRRLVGVMLALWAAITLAFLTIHIVPGNPAEAALSQSTASEDVLERRREALGLDLPLPVQYAHYLRNLLRGDLGVSWSGGEPVGLMIAQQLPPTISLAWAGLTVAVVTGFALGLGAALGQERWLGEASRSITGVLLAVPVMFSGTLAAWVFAILLGWLPATGQGSPGHLILPALVVGLNGAGGISRTVEAGVSEAMRQPFMPAAYAKGLARWQAVTRHALRVGLIPTLDIVALQFGFLLGGTVVTESVFARQGVGRLLLTAVLDKDLPVVQGVIILSAIAYSLLNLAADVAKTWLDPRIRFSPP